MSADDNAPEQAREVEVVLMSHLLVPDTDVRWHCRCTAWETQSANYGDVRARHLNHVAHALAAALAPIRAAERQEAAREAAERAWVEGVESCDSDHMSYFTHKVSENGYATSPNPYRDAVVIGRSGT